MKLYHFSEDPDIAVFEPRTPVARPEIEPLVWAIDEWHAPMYYVPRDCPRACFWPGADTTSDDRERWFGGIEGRMVIAVEASWLERIRTTVLYRYTMPDGAFCAERRDRRALRQPRPHCVAGHRAGGRSSGGACGIGCRAAHHAGAA